jgi:hypothetical protein
MAHWTVGITGNDADLAELAKSLTTPQLLITKKFGSFALESTTFLATDTEGAVRAKAERLLESISGTSRLAFSLLSPLSVTWVALNNDDGSVQAHMTVHETISMRDTVSVSITHADGTVETHNPADIVPDIVAQALKHKVVGEVLKLLARSDKDWVNLYRIFEVVANDVGGLDAMAAQGWASKSELRTFKNTANSPGAIGHDARHGVDTGQPPAAAMQLSEATTLLQRIVQKWVQTKA